MLFKHASYPFVFFTFFLMSFSLHASEKCISPLNSGMTYYVSPQGHNYKGNGSYERPWESIEYAIHKATDNSNIIVKPGIYNGRIKIRKAFEKGVLVKAQYPYRSKLMNNGRVIAVVDKAKNITIEGFEITHSASDSTPLVVHIDSYGKKNVRNITIKNNIIHDSYNNDLLKINNSATHINVTCNLFYNQGDKDEHIDINSVEHVTVSNNIFLNDFRFSERVITYRSSSYIVIKDSNHDEDQFLGSNNIVVNNNVFLNWQGSHGHGFLLIGEDGKPYYEAKNIKIFNNLFLGNSSISMRSPFGIKGARDIDFYNNTTVGNLPSNAYAMRFNRERSNPINDNINIINNIWSDPSGTMGQGDYQKSNDFSDIGYNDLETFTFDNNLVFNGEQDLPYSLLDKINPTTDKHLIAEDPSIQQSENIRLPLWNSATNTFEDGSFSIQSAFLKIVFENAIPLNSSAVQKSTNPTFDLDYDLLGNPRHKPHSVGAIHLPIDVKSVQH